MMSRSRGRASISRLSGVMLALMVSACSVQPPPDTAPTRPAADRLTLEPRRVDQLPGWVDDQHSDALSAWRPSCSALQRAAAPVVLEAPGLTIPFPTVAETCRAAAAVPTGDDAAARRFFETRFQAYAVGDMGTVDGLFTGYYEPELRGSRQPGGPYTVPLYHRPPDLVTVNLGAFRDDLRGRRLAGRLVDGRLVPYPDRAAIDAGALAHRGLELLWVDDAIDAFFLHIQGSGRVVLTDGSVTRVGYAAQNGHAYFAIGRELIRRGLLSRETVSMPAIRGWLAAHPAEADAVMELNRSFVFFRELGTGPIVGAQGVALTPERSLAVDRSVYPLGWPFWIDVQAPLDTETRLRRLMVAQDTGGAIRGPVRGDVFWGHGKTAERKAGVMKSSGRYYLLLPRFGT